LIFLLNCLSLLRLIVCRLNSLIRHVNGLISFLFVLFVFSITGVCLAYACDSLGTRFQESHPFFPLHFSPLLSFILFSTF